MKLEIVFKDGRKETFNSVASFNVTEEAAANGEYLGYEVVKSPTEGKLFEVNPLEIDRKIFDKQMEDQRQERTRQTILEAFVEVDKQPEKYASPFYTLIPKMKWKGCDTVAELKEYAKDLGGLMADWVEQALEWAQRISNGEGWKVICNDKDTANWYRLIVGEDGYARRVGGSLSRSNLETASRVIYWPRYADYEFTEITVPLVVLKKK